MGKAICKICGGISNDIFKVKEMMYGNGESFGYFICSNCGCLQLERIPQDMKKYYPEDYYSFNSNKSRSKKRWLVNVVKQITNKYELTGKGFVGLVGSFLVPNAAVRSIGSLLRKGLINYDSKVLDVGCGDGKLLLELKDLGFKNLLGIDPYLSKDKRVNGVDILRASLLEVNEKFDLIMFHHVMEHISNPEEIFRKLKQTLTPGGIIVIRIPVFPNYVWEKWGTNWVQLDAPRHMFLYSKKSIKSLCKLAGLRIKKVVYDSTGFQFIGTKNYVKGITLKEHEHRLRSGPMWTANKIIELCYNAKATQLNKRGMGDQAVFYIV